MIIALLAILAAFTWLLIETDFLRVRLVVGKIPDMVKPSIKLLMPGKLEPVFLLAAARFDHYSNFIVKDMPITQGINIICKMEA
jgi:hypothetical protein